MAERQDFLSYNLSRIFPGCFSSVFLMNDAVYFTLTGTGYKTLRLIFSFLRFNTVVRMHQLLDLWAVDYPNSLNRFQVLYSFWNIKTGYRYIFILPIKAPYGLHSAVEVFPSANWLEREVWDLFGVYFFNHPDLRRILTDYGFEGHPLRKDFPLTGYVEVRYNEEEKRVIIEPLRVSQEFRLFDIVSPWNSNFK